MHGVKQIIAPVFILSILISAAGCNLLSPISKPKKTQSIEPAKVEISGTLIAKVNNRPITLEELNAEVETFNSYVPQDKPDEKIDTRDKKVAYLRNEMVRKSLLSQAAKDRGLERKEDVRKAMDSFMDNLLVGELIREETAKIEVTSKEIEDYYNQYKEQLKEPEQRHIREIVVSSEEKAKEVLIQALQGSDFAALAQQNSVSDTASKGGDLGFITKGTKSPQFDDMAFSPTLEAGSASNYFKGPGGYYILKLEGKREGQVKTLSELWDDIKNGLTFLKQQQAIEELIGKLSREAKIEVYEGEIK